MMPEVTQAPQSAPVQVQVVEPAKPSIEERFLRHVQNTPIPGTMTPGDTERRRHLPESITQQLPKAEAKPDSNTELTAGEPAAETKQEAAQEAADAGQYEFEWKGAKYQVPQELKELHEGYMRTEDYTRKTQETADIRRSAELMLQQARNSQALQQAIQPHVEALTVINRQLQDYSRVDWSALIDQNFQEAQKHQMQYQRLKDQKQQVETEAHRVAQDHLAKISDGHKQMKAAAEKVLSQKIKGYSSDLGTKLNEFARNTYGFSETEVNSTIDPRVVEMMHDAKAWRELQASKPQKISEATRTLKPAGRPTLESGRATEMALIAAKNQAKTPADKERAIAKLLEHREEQRQRARR